jgi:hypothetical protein
MTLGNMREQGGGNEALPALPVTVRLLETPLKNCGCDEVRPEASAGNDDEAPIQLNNGCGYCSAAIASTAHPVVISPTTSAATNTSSSNFITIRSLQDLPP